MSKKRLAITSLAAIVTLYSILISTLYFLPIVTSKLPIGDTNKLVETNFFNFNEYGFGIFSRKERVLIASNKLDQSARNGGTIFSLSRSSQQLKIFEWDQIVGDLKLTRQYDYKEVGIDVGSANGYEG